MASETSVEERHVSDDEIKNGVKLKAGHSVILILGHGSSSGGDDDSGGDDHGQSGDDHGDQDGGDTPPSDGPGGGEETGGEETEPYADDKGVRPEEEAGTLEVQVVNFAGDPAEGVLCAVKLPDGSSQQVRTDAQGMLRIAALPREGNCEVTFPELKQPGAS